jgi:ribosomal protein L11
MLLEENIKSFSLNLRMGQIEAGPPLSTILGNLGINTVKFCKELNELTNLLPNFLVLEVKIFVNLDKTYSFVICEPSVALILKLISIKKEVFIKTSGGFKSTQKIGVNLKDLYLVCFFKFGKCNNELLKSIYGTLMSSNLNVFK